MTVNAANFVGETEVNADRSSAAVVVQNLGTGAAAGIIGAGTGGNGALNFGYATATDAAVLNVKNGVGNTAQPAVTITSAPTAVTINSTGAANSLGVVQLSNAATVNSLTINADTALSTGGFTNLAATGATVTVKGAASGVASPNAAAAPATVVLGNLQAGVNLTSIDASGLTAGGVQVALNAASTNLQFKGGQGNDNVTTNGGTNLLATASIDAGAGTADRLVIAATADIQNPAAVTSKARGDLYKGFEQVQVQSGQALDVTLLSTSNTIDTIRINDGVDAGTSVTNLSATQAANVTIMNGARSDAGAITIGLTGAGTAGQIDTVKATVLTTTAAGAASNSNLTGIVLTGVENLELTGSNGAVAANVGFINVDTAAATSLSSIKLNNKNSVDTNAGNDNVITVNGAHTATNLTIDATGSGDTQINAANYAPAGSATAGVKIVAGAGNDQVTGSARADDITLGAGSDTFFVSANGNGNNVATPTVDTINDFALGATGDVIDTTNLVNGFKPVLNGTNSAALVTALNAALPSGGTAGTAELIILDSSVTALQAANASALNNLAFALAGVPNQGQVLVAYAASATGDVRLASATIAGGDITNVVDLAVLKGVTTAALNTGFNAANLTASAGGYQQAGGNFNITANTAVAGGAGTDTFTAANAAAFSGATVTANGGTDSIVVSGATGGAMTLGDGGTGGTLNGTFGTVTLQAGTTGGTFTLANTLSNIAVSNTSGVTGAIVALGSGASNSFNGANGVQDTVSFGAATQTATLDNTDNVLAAVAGAAVTTNHGNNTTINVTGLTGLTANFTDTSGAGDILALAALGAGTVTTGAISGFETLQLGRNTALQTITLGATTGLTTLALDSTTASVTVNMSAAQLDALTKLDSAAAGNTVTIATTDAGAVTVNLADTQGNAGGALANVDSFTFASASSANVTMDENLAVTGTANADVLNVTGNLTSGGGVTLGSTNFETVNVTTAQTVAALTMSASVQTLNVQAAGSYVVGAATTLTTVSGGAINATVTDDNTTTAETFRNDGTGRLTVTTLNDTRTADAVTNTSTGTVTVNQVANAGVTTINLNANGAQDIIGLSNGGGAGGAGVALALDRVVVSNFAVANDTVQLDIDQTTMGTTTGLQSVAQATAASTAGITFGTAAADLLILTGDIGGGASVLAGDLTGAALLANLGGALSVANDQNTGYIVAYDNGTAYLYYVTESNDGAAVVAAGDIALIGTLGGVAVDSLAASNFIMI